MNILNAKPVLTMTNPNFISVEETPDEQQEIVHSEPHYLLEDGVTRATVTINNAEYEYDPLGERGPQLLNNNKDADRQTESDENWEQICSLGVKLNDYKQSTIDKNRKEAGIKISAMFGTEYDTDAKRDKQANAQALSSRLQRKEAKGKATAEEIQMLDDMESLLDDVEAIREAENAAAVLIDKAKDIKGVDKVKAPAWPA